MAETEAANARVLLVEDDDELSEAVRLTLEYDGYKIVRAAHGREALDWLKKELPDMILLDVMMPGLDGWQVLREVKSDKRTRDVPVVMMTALAEERDIIQGHLEGAVRYVTKPFAMHDLLDTVAEAVAPISPEEQERRRGKVKTLLRRLAEIDAGRTAVEQVRVSRLEPVPRPARRTPTRPADREKIESLTKKQRRVASELAGGRSARDLAEELGVSRSNIYATRKRIARKLGVRPNEVADEARRLGLP